MYVIYVVLAVLAFIGAMVEGTQPSPTQHYDQAAQTVADNMVRNMVQTILDCGSAGACPEGYVNPVSIEGSGFHAPVDQDENIATDGNGDVIIVWNNNPGAGGLYDYLTPAQVASHFTNAVNADALSNSGGQIADGILYNNTIIGTGNSGITAIPPKMQPSLFAGGNTTEDANGAAIIMFLSATDLAVAAETTVIPASPSGPTAPPTASPAGSSEDASSSAAPSENLTAQSYWKPIKVLAVGDLPTTSDVNVFGCEPSKEATCPETDDYIVGHYEYEVGTYVAASSQAPSPATGEALSEYQGFQGSVLGFYDIPYVATSKQTCTGGRQSTCTTSYTYNADPAGETTTVPAYVAP
jgi:hypothetical protein